MLRSHLGRLPGELTRIILSVDSILRQIRHATSNSDGRKSLDVAAKATQMIPIDVDYFVKRH
ncbi:hypothetical protein KCP73_16185 [Salmonella enterica subsp. enterica]|nr:hypothetical protein KCP73_16185 [Salmonella enterica subsp. enterica]